MGYETCIKSMHVTSPIMEQSVLKKEERKWTWSTLDCCTYLFIFNIKFFYSTEDIVLQ